MIALRIAKAGYYGGDPEKVLKARVDMVIQVMDFEDFGSDYLNVYYEINKNQ